MSDDDLERFAPAADGGPARISMLMPTRDQAAFLPRAVRSLLAQTESRWELLIVDDASPDHTADVVAPFLADARIRYVRRAESGGLGRALNDGLAATSAPLVAYLPSDDVLHRDHLATLLAALDASATHVMAVSGVRHHYNRETVSTVDGWPQLVQVMHRRVEDSWLERTELVTDDLDRMYWAAVRRHGRVAYTGRVTCEWVEQPDQLTRWLREPLGGINPFRQRYEIAHPLRFATSVGDPIDEVARYARFRDRPPTPRAADGLRILLVGELSYNADRILELEERGHELFGLWTPKPAWYTTIGPVPFGHIIDVDPAGWPAAVRRIRPDLIYGLLNWHAVPFAAEVRRRLPSIPFVWHFKEGPFICRERGTWPDLMELTGASTAVVHTSPEVAEWFGGILPPAADPERSLVLDGDLPRADWFAGIPMSRRLSEDDGEIHTVVPGRPIGLHPEDVADLAAEGIHLHFHGSFTQGQWREWIDRTRRLAPDHLHLHETVGPEDWVRVFSRYDAGWLHTFRSRNGGELAAADWDDLNLPARMATLAAADLPMIQRDNTGARVAVQTVGRELGVGLFYRRPDDLGATLRDVDVMDRLRANVRVHAEEFTFDRHVDRLVAFFRRAVDLGPRRRVARSGRNRTGRPGDPVASGALEGNSARHPELGTATSSVASLSLPAWMPSRAPRSTSGA